MLMSADRSCLMLIDVQEKVLPAVQRPQQLVDHCQWLVKVAQQLSVPVLASEQYPRGLGPTVPALRELLDEQHIQDKVIFSCADAPECQALIDQQARDHLILCGMEAHVCVMQTALGLHAQGKSVFVVRDAISARSDLDTECAIERMQGAGIHIVSREMVAFEWLRASSAPEFKAFSKTFLQH